MAIVMDKEHSLGKDEARRRVEAMRDEVETQYGLRTAWAGDDLKVSGSGVKGRICVEDGRVLVDIRLAFAMMLMEGPIRSRLSDAIDKHLS